MCVLCALPSEAVLEPVFTWVISGMTHGTHMTSQAHTVCGSSLQGAHLFTDCDYPPVLFGLGEVSKGSMRKMGSCSELFLGGREVVHCPLEEVGAVLHGVGV